MARRLSKPPLTPRNVVAALVLLAAGVAAGYFKGQPEAVSGQASGAGAQAVLEAYAAQRSDQWLEADGVVARLLPDDKAGDRHQRFIVRVGDDHTVLVAHNIDIAPRIPLSVGDPLSLRGEYEWSDQGGVIHWTHHDPGGRHDGGWIRHAGKTYR